MNVVEFSQLYNRVRYLLKIKRYSQEMLAEYLGVPQTTLSRWLTEGSQKNLFPHLERLLTLWPDVNPEWLYRNIGEPFGVGHSVVGQGDRALAAMQAKVEQLEAELSAERHLNRQLTAKLLIDGVGDKAAVTSIGKAAEGHE